MINLEDIFKNIPIEGVLLLIVSLIVILLLKKTRNKKISQEEKNKKGNDYELLVGDFYNNLGYQVYQKGIQENLNDGGIDIIATKENETLLIQCKNWNINHKYRVGEKEVREFYGACNFYIDENNLDKNTITCIYVVPNNELISIKVKGLFKKHKNNCRYQIIK